MPMHCATSPLLQGESLIFVAGLCHLLVLSLAFLSIPITESLGVRVEWVSPSILVALYRLIRFLATGIPSSLLQVFSLPFPLLKDRVPKGDVAIPGSVRDFKGRRALPSQSVLPRGRLRACSDPGGVGAAFSGPRRGRTSLSILWHDDIGVTPTFSAFPPVSGRPLRPLGLRAGHFRQSTPTYLALYCFLFVLRPLEGSDLPPGVAPGCCILSMTQEPGSPRAQPGPPRAQPGVV